jgi:iron(III) transport system ATP-binding protein
LPANLGDGWVDCRLGRIPADTRGRQGTGEIMLRPDQLTLAPAGDGAALADAATRFGRVTAVEFGGAACTVVVALNGSTSGGVCSALKVRGVSADLPPVGAMVQLTIVGRAHVFEPAV